MSFGTQSYPFRRCPDGNLLLLLASLRVLMKFVLAAFPSVIAGFVDGGGELRCFDADKDGFVRAGRIGVMDRRNVVRQALRILGGGATRSANPLLQSCAAWRDQHAAPALAGIVDDTRVGTLIMDVLCELGERVEVNWRTFLLRGASKLRIVVRVRF